jgi:cob(I)alamin adenosyltransferase
MISLNKNQKVIAKKGLIICYVGYGKGKTTAAMGLAVRALGAGLNVHIIQFVKSPKKDKYQPGEWPISSEINFFEQITTPNHFGKVSVETYGEGFVGILGDAKDKTIHQLSAREGLSRARELINENSHQVLILDELLSAIELDLLSEEDVLELFQNKSPTQHIILTGHKRFEKIFSQADLVTDMGLVKHPYYQGVLAQKGIEF